MHMTLLALLPALAAAAIFVSTFRMRPGSRVRARLLRQN